MKAATRDWVAAFVMGEGRDWLINPPRKWIRLLTMRAATRGDVAALVFVNNRRGSGVCTGLEIETKFEPELLELEGRCCGWIHRFFGRFKLCIDLITPAFSDNES